MLSKLTDVAKGALSEVGSKVQQLMAEFNDAVPIIKGLGLSVTNIRVEVGLTPEISGWLNGRVDDLDETKIKQLIDRANGNKTATAILEALRTAAGMKGALKDIGFQGVTVQTTLALPPKVAITFNRPAGHAESVIASTAIEAVQPEAA